MYENCSIPNAFASELMEDIGVLRKHIGRWKTLIKSCACLRIGESLNQFLRI